MNQDINTLIKKLPDYDDFIKVIEEIESNSRRKSKLEIQIKTMESELVKKVTTDPIYFQAGKMPSMNYIEATWKYTGTNNELVPLRLELAEVTSTLEKSKLRMDVYKTMLDIWRTLSANSRRAEL